MDLRYEEPKEVKKKSIMPIVIGIILFLCVALVIGIIYSIQYLQKGVLKVYINGSISKSAKELVYTTEDGDLYFPIKSIASYLGYTAYTGDFKNKSEDSSKCYVDNGEEIAMFTVGSDSLIISRDDSSAYEEYIIDEKVVEIGGQLYTTMEGIGKAFESSCSYDSENSTLTINTTDYLATYYASKLGMKEAPKKYTDRQAILQGLMIIGEENSKVYGVVAVATGDVVLEQKYDSISYIPYTSDFLVESNGKYGIMTKNAVRKINIVYDEISILDNAKGLYLIKEDNLYGIINSKGESILKASYQQIGIDGTKYEKNSLDSQYILFDTLIPVKYNNMWGFFDLSGNQITNFEYTGVGCSTTSASNTYATVIIPNLKYIVVEKDKKYNLMGIDGALHIKTFALDSVYLTYDGTTGKNTYYMTYNGKVANVEETFAAQQ